MLKKEDVNELVTDFERELNNLIGIANTEPIRNVLNKYEQKVKQTFLDILREIEPEKNYPKDIFPEITKFQLHTINSILKSKFNFPLDRLSAHIGRQILEGNKKTIEKSIPKGWYE